MKRILQTTYTLIFLVGALLSGQLLPAQEVVASDKEEKATVTAQAPQTDPCSKYGPDSTKTLDEASIYVEFYKQKDYVSALPHWRYVFKNAPGYHEAVPVNGMTIYRYLIENETDSLLRERYIDTLLLLYDKRIECFGKECFNLGRKGYDLMKYRPRAYDAILSVYDKAMDACGLTPEYFILYPYTKLMAYKYQLKEVSKEEMFAVFEKISAIVEANKDSDYADRYNKTFESIVKELEEIGILTCKNMREYYANLYKENPDDREVWEKLNLGLAKCNTCDSTYGATFLEAKKKLFAVAPSADLATDIADCESKIGSQDTAIIFLKQAMKMDTSNAQKAKLAYNIARTLYEQGRYTEARNYAYKALEFRPNWGDPYILIGTMYVGSGAICKQENPFYGFAVSLVAVDKFVKAKQVDPSVTDEANRLIAKYSAYFPTTSAVFERNMSEGDSYTVGCWINETTTIRVAE